MKKTAVLLLSTVLICLVSCGGDATSSENAETVTGSKLKGFEELDLTPWGFSLAILVPSDEGDPEVVLTESGALEVVVGSGFGLEINYGEGDLELLKTDLQEDLVFTSEILQEDENSILYKQDIKNSGMKSRNHFLYRATFGSDTYEVKDLINRDYGDGMIAKMLEAARTLKLVEAAA